MQTLGSTTEGSACASRPLRDVVWDARWRPSTWVSRSGGIRLAVIGNLTGRVFRDPWAAHPLWDFESSWCRQSAR
jgi:hypothetical protein